MYTASHPRWLPRGTGALSALLLAALCTPAEAQRAASRGERFVDSLLARMTVEEKLGQLTQLPGQWGNTGPTVSQGGENEIRSGHVGSFLGVHGAAATRRFQEIAMQSRLKIPLLFAHDVIHGFRTIFPVSLAEAASWDPDAVERSARIAAIEATSAGLHWTFAPMVDIARDARWGRIVEGAGEDPYLGSIMAAARVRGFQGTDLSAPNTMMATAKHFVAYGAAEGGRDYNVADVSEITLRDIYLPPFHAAVEAGARSVMASFNEIAGVPVHASERLIDGLLRTEWRWNGLLVSDWTGVLELIPHGVAADSVRAGELALRAGVDVDMVSRIYFTRLAPLVRSGRVPMRDVNAAVRRVLIAKYELGLFDDPFRYSDTARERRSLLAAEHRAAARDLARKAIVLLKNENRTLPLSKSLGTIAVIGSLATDARSTIGNWAAAGRPEEGVTVLDGIRRAMPATARVLYARGADSATADTSGFAEAVRVAREADAVVLVVGEHQEQSAEANNRAFLGLPGAQIGLARAVLATGKPVVIVLMGGRPLAIPVLAEQVPAIMHAWYLGTEMGNAVADVLFGDANPSGKLPVSVPRTVGQVPLYYNHKNTGRPPVADQKYTSKYIDVPWTPLYPFGHGLSYTTFAYRNLRLSRATMRPSDTLVVTVEVTNTGDRAGDEIVQLYVRDEVGSITRPVKELRGFRRISLRPGESQTVSFTLGAKDLAFHDADLDLVVERGFYRVFVGTSSERVEEARFELVDPRRCAKLVLRREVPRFTWPMKSRATVVQCGR
ncbi:MAG TPA: beta-glucosidase BglX [Gemmatimonadaceae bacterium]|nr:beta-glucosidase BglX [Gemmatimonadaceae bacterium]